jgi:aminoglycoside 6'-N-acetyltransferase
MTGPDARARASHEPPDTPADRRSQGPIDAPLDRTARQSAPAVPTLYGEHTVLRPLTAGDAPALLALLTDPGVAAWWQRASWDQINEEGATVLAIVVEGEVAGSIQFHEETDPDYHFASIDIFVGDAWQGRGVGSEALRNLIAYLLGVRGHHRITVDPAAANERAIRVYERLGFRRVGTMHAYERTKDSVWRDALLMELIVDPRGGEGF